MRLTGDAKYLRLAKAVAQDSTCIRRHYGAVIVKNDEIVATGYNGAPRGEPNCYDTGICKREELGIKHNSVSYENTCVSVHAEQNAIISAARSEMIGSTLYLYGEDNNGNTIDAIPCDICKRLIKNAGIMGFVGSKKINGYNVC